MRLMHRSRRRRSARAGLLCRLFSPSHPGKLLIVSGRQAPRQGEQEGMQMNYRFHAGIAALATCLAGSPVQAQESSQTQMSSDRSEEHTSELQSLMRISYAVFCLKKKNK